MTSPRCCSSWSRSRHRVCTIAFMVFAALSESSIRGLIGLDGRAAATLVAESGGRIVAFAGYHRDPRCLNRAEVAFAVSDAFQGHGIGTRLLEQLSKAAVNEGIDTFDAYVIGDNRRMLDVFRDSGFAETVTVETGVCHVVLSLPVTEHSLDRAAARSRVAATAVDAAILRARRRGRGRRQPRTRKDWIGNPEQSRHRRVHRRDRTGTSDRTGDWRPDRVSASHRHPRSQSISR